ncbi:endo-beta-N-acetylglucosaminidase [Streptomyces huiliensis]|uniref:endo-beta-N-acetylglucosaminidase n=1 Tax=Streptomyces huiliensis TaxID=2876027 RepID=UPI001CBAE49F|nr:hypothetical protein [Streptomyces huiliensis]MBZ4319454.1 hypothetical protein [Streptomyces huiliensis]
MPASSGQSDEMPGYLPDICPYASTWVPSTLLEWNPQDDPDADFNRSRTPLARRVRNLRVKANPHAREGAHLASLAEFHETSNNPSQGALTWQYYAFGYWQYVDVLVMFGGSLDEGLILAPNPTIIDAAHRNGVKVYGTVFFPEQAAAVRHLVDLVQEKAGRAGVTYPVADKLVEVALAYGFDGWFINQEVDASHVEKIADKCRDFMAYVRARGAGAVEVMWYDAMTRTGAVRYQNALTAENQMFFQDQGRRIADSLFLNYWWTERGLDDSAALARKLGRDPYELYAGLEVARGSYDLRGICPPDKAHRVSVGLYPAQRVSVPPLPEMHRMNLAEYYRKESAFWVGPNADPSDTAGASGHPGIAHCLPEQSPVCEMPFVTSFNTGHGTAYYDRGTRVRDGGWHSLSLQDILPTYRWIIRSDGPRLTPSLDFDDAYHGGTSLLLQGRIEDGKPNLLRLYQSELAVAPGTRISVTAKSATTDSVHLKAALALSDAPDDFVLIDLGAVSSAGWQTLTADLSAYRQRVITQIGLHFSVTPDSTAAAHTAIRIGRLAVHQDEFTAPAAPTGAAIDAVAHLHDRKALRLRWVAPDPGEGVHHWEVYRTNPSVFLAATTNTVCYVPEVLRHGTENRTTLSVVAVGPDGRPSQPASPAPAVTWD